MILDAYNQFADGTAVPTSGTGTLNVGDVIDLGPTVQDLGPDEDLYLVVRVETAFTSGGSATVKFRLASDSSSTLATDGTATSHIESETFAVADLTANKEVLKVKLPYGDYEKYLGMQIDVGTAALTAGAIDAFLTTGVDANRHYTASKS